MEITDLMNGLLLSGGMDSTSIAWWKRPDIALTVDYGQKAADAEIDASKAVCKELGIPHEIIHIDCSHLGSGDMAGISPLEIAPVPEWWPFRNQLIITIAAMAGVKIGLTRLMLGAVASDKIHADGRLEFLQTISQLVSMQEGGIEVTAPAQKLSTVELVQSSAIPQEILAWAHSCHTGNVACGVCRGCIKHYKTWEALGYAPY